MSPTPLPRLALVLAVLLVIWEPATFALAASAALSRLALYGAPAFLLGAYRSVVVGVGIAAGRALWAGRREGRRLAQWWAVLDAAGTVLTFATPYFPSNRLPGTKGPLLALLLTVNAAWFLWLQWGPSVRRAYAAE